MATDKLTKIFDVIGIGIGPFNLGLAALLQRYDLSFAFFDKQAEFSWHPGLMLDWSRMQVPFYADLVTLEDPTSTYSYLNFLKETDGLLRHGILENQYPLRSEFQAYCAWVAGQLSGLNFGYECKHINFDAGTQLYEVYFQTKDADIPVIFYAKNIVVGIGNEPYYPCDLKSDKLIDVFHGSSYLYQKEHLKTKKDITIIGSGQSAAEVFYDLLLSTNPDVLLHWVTRSDRFFPMEGGPFAFSLSHPHYIDWFFQLPQEQKTALLASQSPLYKGVNADLLKLIYEKTDMEERNGIKRTKRLTGERLSGINYKEDKLKLVFKDSMEAELFLDSEAVVLCTGYRFNFPDFLKPIAGSVVLNEQGYPLLNKNYSSIVQQSLYFQNADLYSHGFNSADLGLGPFRNGIIISSLESRA